MNASEKRQKIMEEAWVGDAVLCLYARRRILRETGVVDGDRFERMTSNRFLTSKGEASEVEAQIGRIYAGGGLEPAFAWIEEELMPLFERQEEKRMRGLRARR